MFNAYIDTGGTFTDSLFVDQSGNLKDIKVPSTPPDFSVGVLKSLEKAAQNYGMSIADFAGELDLIVHGSTVGSNALFTLSGAKLGMITTKGFRDIIELRRGLRHDVSPFVMSIPPPNTLVPRNRRIGVQERIAFDGRELESLNHAEVQAAVDYFVGEGVESVAVCFLFSFLNQSHEEEARRLCEQSMKGKYVTTSSGVLPYVREFERFSTCVVDAYVGPVVSGYVRALADNLVNLGFKGKLLLMQANGGTQSTEISLKQPVYTIESGPAAAPVAALNIASKFGIKDILAVDMGGTTFKACLIKDGEIPTTDDTWISDHPIAVKMVDVRSIGAGGGSIAWLDTAGLLHVGPKSAGASPGPVCYGLGGLEPTCTDANVVLGYISPSYFLGGEIVLSEKLARAAIDEKIGRVLKMNALEASDVIHTLINSSMASAIGEVSIQRGHDPRDFTMVVGGGAAPAHAVRLAEEVGISKILIPKLSGLLCSFGMLCADLRHDYVNSHPVAVTKISPEKLESIFKGLEARGLSELSSEGVQKENVTLVRTADMRYSGQYHEVEVGIPGGDLTAKSISSAVSAFHEQHRRIFTFSMLERQVEFLNFRVRAIGKSKKVDLKPIPGGDRNPSRAIKGKRDAYFREVRGLTPTDIYDGDILRGGDEVVGPAIIEERTTTIVLPPNFSCQLSSDGIYAIDIPTKGNR